MGEGLGHALWDSRRVLSKSLSRSRFQKERLLVIHSGGGRVGVRVKRQGDQKS